MTHHNGGDSRVPVNGTGVGDSNTGLRERRPSSVNSERSKVHVSIVILYILLLIDYTVVLIICP